MTWTDVEGMVFWIGETLIKENKIPEIALVPIQLLQTKARHNEVLGVVCFPGNRLVTVYCSWDLNRDMIVLGPANLMDLQMGRWN